MLQGPERIALVGLLGGLAVTSVLIIQKLYEADTTVTEVVQNTLTLYKYQIVILVLTILAILSGAYLFQKRAYKKEKVPLKCTNKISTDEYEKTKKALTDEAVKKLVESEAYKKYLDDKNNNRLRNIELDESDKIVLSDDSGDEEEEREIIRQ